MSARLPYPVAQGNRGLEHSIPVARPAIRSRHGRTYVEPRFVTERRIRPRSTRPLRLREGRIARITELSGGRLLGQRAARDYGDAYGNEVGPGNADQRVEGGALHHPADAPVTPFLAPA